MHTSTREPHSKRVQVGDVVFIREGRLYRLFSAGCPRGKRKLGVDVPDTFQQLKMGEIDECDPLPAGHFSTNGVQASSSQPLPYARSVTSFSWQYLRSELQREELRFKHFFRAYRGKRRYPFGKGSDSQEKRTQAGSLCRIREKTS